MTCLRPRHRPAGLTSAASPRYVFAFVGKVFLAVSACVLLSSPSSAQGPDLSQASLEELMNVKVYSASKHLENSQSAPALVTVVTADEIQKYGYRTLADVLRSVGALYVTYDRNYSYVGARGFGRPGDYNARLLVLMDGHRLNEPIYD